MALLLTYQGFSGFRRSWLFILTGHVIFTMPFMVRSVMAVFATVDIKTLDEGEEVSFDVVASEKGPKAQNVQRLRPGPA